MKQSTINIICMIIIVIAVSLIVSGLILELVNYLEVGGFTI